MLRERLLPIIFLLDDEPDFENGALNFFQSLPENDRETYLSGKAISGHPVIQILAEYFSPDIFFQLIQLIPEQKRLALFLKKNNQGSTLFHYLFNKNMFEKILTLLEYLPKEDRVHSLIANNDRHHSLLHSIILKDKDRSGNNFFRKIFEKLYKFHHPIDDYLTILKARDQLNHNILSLAVSHKNLMILQDILDLSDKLMNDRFMITLINQLNAEKNSALSESIVQENLDAFETLFLAIPNSEKLNALLYSIDHSLTPFEKLLSCKNEDIKEMVSEFLLENITPENNKLLIQLEATFDQYDQVVPNIDHQEEHSSKRKKHLP